MAKRLQGIGRIQLNTKADIKPDYIKNTSFNIESLKRNADTFLII